jgi:hypothetical protein
MGVDNWFFGLAVSVPAKADHNKTPSRILCPEESSSLCALEGFFRIQLMHHNKSKMPNYSAQ